MDEFTTWLTQLHEGADDNLKEHVKAVIENEKLKNTLKSSFMAHSDYTKKTQALAEKQAELEETAGKLNEWYRVEGPRNVVLANQLKNANEELEKVKKQQIELKKKFFEEGEPVKESPTTPPSIDTSKFVTVEDYQKLANRLALFDKNSLRFNLDMDKVQRMIAKEGFDLDMEKVYAHASKTGSDLVEAYKTLTATEREQRREADIQKRIDDAKASAVREALTKHNLPDSPGRDVASSFEARFREGLSDPAKRRDAALARFHEATPKV